MIRAVIHFFFYVVVVVVQVSAVSAGELTTAEKAIARNIDKDQAVVMEILRRSVDINSGTMNHAGVREVGALIKPMLDELGFETRWITLPAAVNRAGHLFAERRGKRGKKLLLIGHLDTVFEPRSPFQTLTIKGRRAVGPGAVDMKGGNVVILSALRALHAEGALDDTSIAVALIGDEEKAGRPLSVSRKDLIEAGRRADVALGFEQGIEIDGVSYASVGRRSSTPWRLEVTGRQGHSSGIFGERAGAGAIFEASRILNAFYDQVRGERFVTFNAGVILGGTQVSYDSTRGAGKVSGKTNIIPRKVIVTGGLRCISTDQLARTKKKMAAIVAQNYPVTSATLKFGESYPPMTPTPGNERLLASYSQASIDLGLGVVRAYDPARRGAADISFVASYADSLAGLGPNGTGSHGPNETLLLDSLPVAAKRAAVLIYRLTR